MKRFAMKLKREIRISSVFLLTTTAVVTTEVKRSPALQYKLFT